MNGFLTKASLIMNNAYDKTKKFADIIYLTALFLFVAGMACCYATREIPLFAELILVAGKVLLVLTGIYRVVFIFFKKSRTAILAIAVLLFAFIYAFITGDEISLVPIAFAMAGAIDVNADLILIAGIAGNIVLIITNAFISIFGDPGLFFSAYQQRSFFYLGDNAFYLFKFNNCSSTDFASHYFWIITAYLWLRSKKITWGEIAALTFLDILVYSLTASQTSFVCITLVILFAVILKIFIKTDKKLKISDSNTLYAGSKKFISFVSKYAFIILSAFCFVFAAFYNSGNPFFYKVNELFHQRMSAGHRGLIEYGVSLFAADVPSYGISSSADGYYNFLDCSYISVLIRRGILVLVFYLICMTAIQLKHKKYLFGCCLIAVCAMSCVVEHHMAELPYNFFLFLLFADFNEDKKISLSETSVSKPEKKTVSIISFAAAAIFLVSVVFVNYPRFKAVNDLNKLDKKAESIYASIQSNIDRHISDGTWLTEIKELSSYQYGDLMLEPEDFRAVTGLGWKEVTKDPKSYSYYSLSYSSGEDSSYSIVTDLLFSDQTLSLIGDGSVVVEYDVSSGKVYSVWYSEDSGCTAITNGRFNDRAGRLMANADPEGYFAGAANG